MQIMTDDQVAIANGCLEAKLFRERGSMLFAALDDIWDNGSTKDHVLAAAVIDGKYVGVAAITRRLRLVQVFVAVAYRRQGIGSLLVDAVLEKTGLKREVCECRPEGEAAHAFFKKNLIIDYPDVWPITKEELERMNNNPGAAMAIMSRYKKQYRNDWYEQNRPT